MIKWQDTVIKSKDIKWVRPRVKSINDGKLDFDIHLPLTDLFEWQAKMSFVKGVYATCEFFMTQENLSKEDIYNFLIECGLPEVAKYIKEQQ